MTQSRLANLEKINAADKEEIKLLVECCGDLDERNKKLAAVNAEFVNLLESVAPLIDAARHFLPDDKAQVGLNVVNKINRIVAMAKQPKDQPYCGECMKPAANCDCGEF